MVNYNTERLTLYTHYNNNDALPNNVFVPDSVCYSRSNLLLPAGVSADRQRAVYTVTVFEAEDLPQCDVGILASMRKVISQASHLSSYVKVSFLGHVVSTHTFYQKKL